MREPCLCTPCLITLPRTRMHDRRENALEKLFWGKSDIHQATAFLHMTKKGITRRMIHELKYKGNDRVGTYLGRLFGAELKKTDAWKDVDLLIPVPLHPKKERERGYNQSAKIACGMSESLHVPWRSAALVRQVHSTSQTRKSRIDRWENVETIFAAQKEHFTGIRHCLIVDDVITTGATIEACALAIRSISSCKISVAALAKPSR